MTEKKVIELIIDHLQSNHPRQCTQCDQEFTNLQEYLSGTEPVGKPISYDANLGNWTPENPKGAIALAICNCCGTTLSVSSKGLSRAKMWVMLYWVKRTTRARGISVSELLEDLRSKIHARLNVEDKNGQNQNRVLDPPATPWDDESRPGQ